MSVKIYHNPRCSKSRQTLEIIREQGIEPEIKAYLKDPPSAADIHNMLELLEMDDPRQLMRKNEAPYKELDLKDLNKSREELIEAMAAHPILIERPVVLSKKGARIGRPPESVKEILP